MNSGRESMLSYILALVLFSIPHIVIGQVDTLVRYDIQTGLIEYFEFPVPLDTPDVAWTPSSPSLNTNILDMSLIPLPPLFPESNFSELVNAEDYLNVEHYPASANVKIWSNKNPHGGNVETGVFIDKNLILTNIWDIYDDDPENQNVDSIYVYPCYDNGDISSFGQTEAVAIYLSLGSYLGYPDQLWGAAIIETADNLGNATGWVGLQYCRNDSEFLDRNYYEFNYPNSILDGDTTERYNGDTLYYSAGQLDEPYDLLGYNRSGIYGQGGSSLLSDANGDVVSVGHLMYSFHSIHRKISYPLYCAVQHLFETNNPSSININTPNTYEMVSFYPNPFNGSSTFSFTIPKSGPVTIMINDINGRRIFENSIPPQSRTQYKFTWQPNDNVSSGVYFVQIISNQVTMTGKVLHLK